ncbi:MAG: hypothetical protein AB4042_08145 [Leptolyngbyaceae cyanobacterium]
MAIEFSVLSRQCLNWRIPTQATLEAQIPAWQEKHNAKKATVNGQVLA